MKSALASLQTLPLKDAARQLLAKLGYKSDKFIVGAGSTPQDFSMTLLPAMPSTRPRPSLPTGNPPTFSSSSPTRNSAANPSSSPTAPFSAAY